MVSSLKAYCPANRTHCSWLIQYSHLTSPKEIGSRGPGEPSEPNLQDVVLSCSKTQAGETISLDLLLTYRDVARAGPMKGPWPRHTRPGGVPCSAIRSSHMLNSVSGSQYSHL